MVGKSRPGLRSSSALGNRVLSCRAEEVGEAGLLPRPCCLQQPGWSFVALVLRVGGALPPA